MTINKPQPVEPSHIDCDACLTEIPPTVAQTPEGDDYIQHYCGLECHDQLVNADQEPKQTDK